jgi:phenylacetic acid degradation operon negative regulatory protein
MNSNDAREHGARPLDTLMKVIASHAPQPSDEHAELAGDDGSEARPWGVAQRPPRLLLTLLGDYWWQHTESLPSAALVALLAEFGVSDSAARAALSRLTRNRLLVTSKIGRRTFVRLSERAAQILDEGARHIFSFGRDTLPWDGMWSLVAFSIPEDNRAARDALRKQLRWLGFAPLYDGLWVAPRDQAAEVVARLSELGIGTATAFRASTVPGIEPDGFPQRAWDLDDLNARYRAFISFAQRLRERALAGRISPVEALVARTRVMDEWRAFPGLDPDLPAELLPDAWPRAAARELFIASYDLLGPLAAHRVRQIIARYSRDLATKVAYHSSELTAAGGRDGRGRDRADGAVAAARAGDDGAARSGSRAQPASAP